MFVISEYLLKEEMNECIISESPSSWPQSGGVSRVSTESLQDQGLSAAAWSVEWLGPRELCLSPE